VPTLVNCEKLSPSVMVDKCWHALLLFPADLHLLSVTMCDRNNNITTTTTTTGTDRQSDRYRQTDRQVQTDRHTYKQKGQTDRQTGTHR